MNICELSTNDYTFNSKFCQCILVFLFCILMKYYGNPIIFFYYGRRAKNIFSKRDIPLLEEIIKWLTLYSDSVLEPKIYQNYIEK